MKLKQSGKISMYIPEALKTYTVITILVAGAFWFASNFIAPTPPKEITMAAGGTSGDYYRYAGLYKKELAKEGITLNVLKTAGSIENIALLKSGKADIAFIQSGLSSKKTNETIQSLGALYYEPLWVFSRNKDSAEKDLHSLNNAKLAIGKAGSGTNALARQLLNLNGLTKQNTLIEMSGNAAFKALQDKTIDAAFFIARPQSPLIQKLLHDEKFHLLSFERAKGYARLLPFLSGVELNQGVIDLAANIPDHEITLISPAAQLTVAKDFNGALKTLLVRTALEIHDEAGLFSQKGNFPTLEHTDFPIAEEATRYFKYGPNFLQRVLPFWLADTINRMVVMLIPLIGVMFPLMKIAPPTYRWQTRSKIYKWYKSLKKIEDAPVKTKTERAETLKALEEIDTEVRKTKVPLSYTDELYNLRLHIKMIKEHLQ